ncbi:MAG: thiol oxidoreductase [Mesorhizobium sp.]|nr:di-heme oxidoredictase family protein [Mesorhizobium sp.]MCO5160414.1 thiol oxidoreductase [Mesorhizobium sp.]
MKLRLTILLLMAATAVAAGGSRDDLSPTDLERVRAITRPASDFSKPEKFEKMQGGAATTPKVGDANALSQPSANLSFADRERFFLGNGIFRKDWVSSPSSTQASDGLGPLFNSRNCQACHIKDGRGHAPPSPGADAVSYLVRLSVPPDEQQAAQITAGLIPAVPDPVYGLQLQDHAIAGLAPEGEIHIEYEDVPVTLAAGETVTLRKPALSIDKPGFGPFATGLMVSGRLAPAMSGMGLLEAIHDADIMARSDPDDRDGDGISGRPNLIADGKGGLVIGRFGWKAAQPSVEQQTVHAFSGDMGLSTPILPDNAGDCTAAQPDCRAMPHGAQERYGDTEVPRDVLDLVVFYSQNLAPPVRRGFDEPDVLAGKAAFYQAGCPACHVPKYVTSRIVAHEAQRFQLIWPYTDLLLHDMGPGLADGRGEGLADGTEWRTAPLWGIGLAHKVSAEAGFLHDGRARTLQEAILWHGGEAQSARDAYAALPKAERDALVTFLESL